jgi:carboxymethylenebutenolidase
MRNTTIDIAGEAVRDHRPTRIGPVLRSSWCRSGGAGAHIQHVVQRLADEGFVALAVDYYRGVETTEPDEAMKFMIGLNIAQVGADLAAAADDLLARDEVQGDTVCVVGFCMGGGLALLGPTVSSAICCVSAFYPALPWPDYAPDWTRYADKSAMVHKAESDEEGTGAAIAQYAEAIAANGGSVEIFDYPHSVHAFFNDARPEVYQAENARLAWERTIAFFHACSD